MSSLRDQLFAAGLTDKQSLKNARKAKQQKTKAPKKERGKISESAKLAEQTRLIKAQKDKELNRQRQQAAEQKAQQAQIKQLIQSSKIDREDGDIAYSFTFDKKVKNIYVTAEQQTQLSRGQIIIVMLSEDQFELVPNVVAQKIAQRDASIVIDNTEQADQLSEDDDPYADYKIPDDLIW